MAGAAIPRRAVIQFARMRFGPLDQLFQVFRFHLFRVYHQHARHLRQQRDRDEILDRIVRKFREHGRVHRHRADVAQDDCVAVRRTGLGLLHRDIAGAAWLAFNDHGLAQRFLYLRCKRARNDIRTPARCERHQQADGLCRIGLCLRATANQRTDHGTRHEHRHLPTWSRSP